MTEADKTPEQLSEAFIRTFARRIQAFRDVCTKQNSERGLKIFEDGGVQLTSFDEISAKADVSEGENNVFHASISFRGGVWNSECTCGEWGNRDDHCRHVVALVRSIEQLKNEATGCAPFIGLPLDEDEIAQAARDEAQSEEREARRRTIDLENARDWLGITSGDPHSFRYDIDFVPPTTHEVGTKPPEGKMLSVSILRIDGAAGLASTERRPVRVATYLKSSHINSSDRKAFAVIENGQRSLDDAYQFNVVSAGPVLQAISGAYVRRNNRPVDVFHEPGRVAAQIETKEGRKTFTLHLETEEGAIALSALEFVSEYPVFALRGQDLIQVETDATLAQLKRWQAHPTLSLPREDDQAAMDAMNALVALGVSFGGVESEGTQRDEALFSLTLDGDAEVARARLSVRYGAVELPLTKAEAKNHITSDGRLIRRDVTGEKAALEALKRAGLNRDGQWFVAKGDRAIDFWTTGIREIPSDWVFFGAKPKEVVHLRTLAPRVAVNLSRNCWFDLDIEFSDKDVHVDLGAIRNQIALGRRYVRLSDGTVGELPKALTEHIRRILEVTGKEPEGSKLSLEPYEASEVDRLLESVPGAKPSRLAKKQLDTMRGTTAITVEPPPSGLVATFRPYQQTGFDWLVFLYKIGLGGVLADDMGLGKTLQTLALLQWAHESNKSHKPHLIIAPTSVLTNWKREAQKFTPNLKVLVYEGLHRESLLDEFKKNDLILTSYAIIRRDGALLKKYKFDCVVLDEAQHLKNPASHGAKAVSGLQSDHRFALTGTPIENQLSDLWSIFHLLMPGFLGNESFFRNTFARPIEADGNIEVKERLKKRIGNFVLRRLKQEVAKDLPLRTDTVLHVQLSEGQQALYKEMANTARTRVENFIDRYGMAKAHISILSELLRLRQVCNDPKLLKMPPGIPMPPSAKLEAFSELVHDLISEGHKALVFSQFTEMLAILVEWAQSEGITYEYLDGKTSDRQARIDRFNAVDGPPLFFISLKAGGTGLNLTGADYVIIFDPWWNPAVEEQAIDRAHRIGQEKPVFSYRLITQGTVEQKIIAMQERKKRLAQGVVQSDEEIGKQLTSAELIDLFSEDFTPTPKPKAPMLED